MKALVGMTDFVFYIDNNREFARNYDKILTYANFLKQPLELWMFVPCAVDGEVLEEPQWWHRYNCGASPFMNWDEIRPCQQYQKAKERCFFEGFEVRREFWGDNTFVDYIQIGRNSVHKLFRSNNDLPWYLSDEYDFKSIEELTKYNLTLTPTALKQIGL